VIYIPLLLLIPAEYHRVSTGKAPLKKGQPVKANPFIEKYFDLSL
jgi:hypothetical protein